MDIIIVDDDRLVCAALKTIIEAQAVTVKATGHSGGDGVKLYFQHKPDIVLMDIRMDPMSGLEAAQQILSRDPKAKILFLTTFTDDEYIVQALKIGVKGYILKQNFEIIVPALRAVASNQSVFGEDIVNKIPDLLLTKKEPDLSLYEFCEKDMELIRLVSEGLSNRDIATSLFLSEGTVRNYLSVIMEKLHLKSRTQLVIFYYNHLR